jgi:hypothetical protein
MPSALTATEHQEQAALMAMCAALEGQHPEIALLYAIPNGGHRHVAVAARLKAEGVKAGVPDLHLPVARGRWHGLYLELKVGRNKPTPEQAQWHERLRAQGYAVVVCYGADQALTALQRYLEWSTG